MARRKVPVVRGEMQSPVVISPDSIQALVGGLVAGLPAAVGAAVDNRLQGRKLLREIAKGHGSMLQEIAKGQAESTQMLREISGKLDVLGRKSGREHSKILKSVRGS